MWKYVSFSGGGINGVLQLGALQYIEKYLLACGTELNLKGACGSSIGALLALLMTCGFSVHEQIAIFKRHYKTISTINVSLNFFRESYACQDAKELVNIMQDLLESKFQVRDLTFQDLFERSGRDLVITAVNLEECSVRLFSHNRSPNVSVIQATMASMSIPLVFPAVEIEGQKYVDGGTMLNYPCNVYPPYETLGLYLLQDRLSAECKGFKNYFKQVAKAVFFAQDEYVLHMAQTCQNMILLRTSCPLLPPEPDRYNVNVHLFFGGLQAALKWRFNPVIFLWFVSSLGSGCCGTERWKCLLDAGPGLDIS